MALPPHTACHAVISTWEQTDTGNWPGLGRRPRPLSGERGFRQQRHLSPLRAQAGRRLQRGRRSLCPGPQLGRDSGGRAVPAPGAGLGCARLHVAARLRLTTAPSSAEGGLDDHQDSFHSEANWPKRRMFTSMISPSLARIVLPNPGTFLPKVAQPGSPISPSIPCPYCSTVACSWPWVGPVTAAF